MQVFYPSHTMEQTENLYAPVSSMTYSWLMTCWKTRYVCRNCLLVIVWLFNATVLNASTEDTDSFPYGTNIDYIKTKLVTKWYTWQLQKKKKKKKKKEMKRPILIHTFNVIVPVWQLLRWWYFLKLQLHLPKVAINIRHPWLECDSYELLIHALLIFSIFKHGNQLIKLACEHVQKMKNWLRCPDK